MSTADLSPEPSGATPTSLLRRGAAEAAVAKQAAVFPAIECPVTVVRRQINWFNASIILAFHALLPLMFVPYFFSWYGLLWLPLGNYIFCSLGIGAGFHRLLTHRGYQCPRWFEYTLATLGVCCMQDTPSRWVAHHRMHHNHADEQPDPHSPLVTLFWGHMGWLLIENTELNKMPTLEKYSRDLIQLPYYRWLESHFNFGVVLFTQAALFAGLGAWYGALCYGEPAAIMQCAAQWLFWGVFVRVIYTWHVTWSVNSFGHAFGYRNYETHDNSRNNWFIGLITHGDGWHNNHHADPRSARHGHRWWELDLTYATIRLWEKCGLAWNLVLPRRKGIPHPEVPQEAEAA